MSKHTPGPWWVEIETAEDAEWSSRWPTIQSKNYKVVGTEGLYGDIETDIANARLIAIAPEMYDYISSAASNGCADAQRLIAMIDKAAIKAVEEWRNE